MKDINEKLSNVFFSACGTESVPLSCSEPHTLIKKRIFFLFNHRITILSLFTYSVCNEKVKKKQR